LRDRAREQWRRGAARWLPALDHAVRERHGATGDLAFLLEPDLKESRGGLRDVTVLHAAAVACPVVAELPGPVAGAVDALMTARVELHRLTGRASDQLRLQDQGALAKRLGDGDTGSMLRDISA